jgi:tripartite-type tricarboxylate transporter receptor subunit TctC
VKDFAPVLLLADAPLLLLANKAVPANDLNEFVAWLKANPDKASMGTVGAGSPGHLLGLLLQKETGTRFGLVAYRGAGPIMQDIVAGQIEATFVNPATSLPHVRAGSIKVFAVTAKNRLAVAPDIPSMDEAGLPGFHFSLWAGLFAPAGTPKTIISKLNAAGVNTMDDPTIRQKLTDQGFELPPRERQTPEALGAYQKAEIEKWWPIIKAAGIKTE